MPKINVSINNNQVAWQEKKTTKKVNLAKLFRDKLDLIIDGTLDWRYYVEPRVKWKEKYGKGSKDIPIKITITQKNWLNKVRGVVSPSIIMQEALNDEIIRQYCNGVPIIDGFTIPALPVDLYKCCINKINEKLGVRLPIEDTKLSTVDGKTTLVCIVSKHKGKRHIFKIEPTQKKLLERAITPYLAFGFSSPERTLLFPYKEFSPLLKNLSTKFTPEGKIDYWQVYIIAQDDKIFLYTNKGNNLDITKYLI